MNCVSCDICVYHFWFVFFVFCFSPCGVFLSAQGSRVTGACPVTADLIMIQRDNNNHRVVFEKIITIGK